VTPFPASSWEKYGHLWESKRRYDVDDKELLKPGPLVAYPRTDEALRVEALRAAVTIRAQGKEPQSSVVELAKTFYGFLKGEDNGGASKD